MIFLGKGFISFIFESNILRTAQGKLQFILFSKLRVEDCCHKKKVHEEKLMGALIWFRTC